MGVPLMAVSFVGGFSLVLYSWGEVRLSAAFCAGPADPHAVWHGIASCGILTASVQGYARGMRYGSVR